MLKNNQPNNRTRRPIPKPQARPNRLGLGWRQLYIWKASPGDFMCDSGWEPLSDQQIKPNYLHHLVVKTINKMVLQMWIYFQCFPNSLIIITRILVNSHVLLVLSLNYQLSKGGTWDVECKLSVQMVPTSGIVGICRRISCSISSFDVHWIPWGILFICRLWLSRWGRGHWEPRDLTKSPCCWFCHTWVTMALHWNHLGSFRNYWCLDPTLRDADFN